MKSLKQSFSVSFQYPVLFTRDVFSFENPALLSVLNSGGEPKRMLFVIDQGALDCHPQLINLIEEFVVRHHQKVAIVGKPVLLPGGEQCKNDYGHVTGIFKVIDELGIDRHSYIVAIGGGSVLDTVGYAAAVCHRGVRLIRIPTTVLSQNDSGVGVKNGVNAYGKKNFIGSFAPPVAVINDSNFLSTLHDRDWRSGIAEGIKVGLIKDPSFFNFIEVSVPELLSRNMEVMEQLIYRCAELHLQHIASGDPFEKGSSRPLDFGHWSAHKLEQLTDYQLRHGEAVALGMSLDAVYSYLEGRLTRPVLIRILNLMRALGFDLFHEAMNGPELLVGLREFQEHLGGQLTVMLIEGIGKGVEVHHIDKQLMKDSIKKLHAFQRNNTLDP